MKYVFLALIIVAQSDILPPIVVLKATTRPASSQPGPENLEKELFFKARHLASLIEELKQIEKNRNVSETCPHCQGFGWTWLGQTDKTGHVSYGKKPCLICGGTGKLMPNPKKVQEAIDKKNKEIEAEKKAMEQITCTSKTFAASQP